MASMRMRMDDYAPPKPRRNDQGAAIPPLMEQVVVRARREASTRTKDTFWTKKLLDAEDQYSKRGDRWAHSGFKELYRDELGYEPEPPQPPADDGGDVKQRDPREAGGPPPRDPRGEPRDPRDPRRNSPNRPRDPRPKPRDPRTSPERPRDPRTAAPARPRDPRRPGDAVALRKDSSPRRRSASRSRGRSRGRQSPLRRHRRHRRSISGSGSSGSSSSSSGSFSRSYSRSSYSRSSSGSSSYTSSSSSRSRSRSRKQTYGKRRRSRSPGSRSRSSSQSPPRNRGKGVPDMSGKRGGGRPPPPLLMSKDIKKQPGSLHETTKKVVTKTVSNVVTTKTKMISAAAGHVPPSHVKQSHRVKAKMKIKEDESLRKKGHGRPPLPHPAVEPGGPGPSASYYPNDEVNDSTIAKRGSNGVPPRGGASSLTSPSILSQPPPPLAVHHHHHNLDIYPASKPAKKLPPSQHLQHPADFPPPAAGPSNNNNPPSPRSPNEESESSSSSEEEETPRKMTLSERFGKLAQLSSQRQEYDGVRMKIVREGGQDKKVYLEAGLGSRSPSPLHPAHERWLAEHQTEYADYQRRYGDVRSWDPHRDLPRDLPPNWEDVGVRYRYYKQSGYFGDRHISLDDYLKWEEWWYQYRDWLKKYGGAAADAGLARHGKEVEAWGDTAAYDRGRVAARWPQDTTRDAAPERKRRRF